MKKSFLTLGICILFLLVGSMIMTQEAYSDNSTNIENMLKAHPSKPIIEIGELTEAIKTISDCSLVCTICADACIGQKDNSLLACIRDNLDCADICNTTAILLSRQTETPVEILKSQLKTCATACKICGDQCKMHAEKYEHCRICADVCFNCEKECNELLSKLP